LAWTAEAIVTRTGIMLATLMMMSIGYTAEAPKKDAVIIGDARMTEDGTIIVNMRRTADGINVSGIVKYRVDDPHYKEVLDHLGGMRPGETRLVPAWDDPAPQAK
jgi:hypothetical protein